jgi:hypothetical protein
MDLGGRGNRHGAVEWRDPASGGRWRMGPEWAAALERGRRASVGRSTRTRAERSEAVPTTYGWGASAVGHQPTTHSRCPIRNSAQLRRLATTRAAHAGPTPGALQFVPPTFIAHATLTLNQRGTKNYGFRIWATHIFLERLYGLHNGLVKIWSKFHNFGSDMK